MKAMLLIVGVLSLLVLGIIVVAISGGYNSPPAAQPNYTPAQQEAMAECCYRAERGGAQGRNPEERPRAAENRYVDGAMKIKGMMKDPDSFKLKSAIMMPPAKGGVIGAACYTYSATNTFGGRILEHGLMTPSGKLYANSDENNPEGWNKYCGGKTGGTELVQQPD
jgi:hypothetical protein